jgi:single-strand DNA-binding protein
MAKSINQVIIMGNLTRDPELRSTPNGQSVCSFSMALNRSYKDASGNWQELTDFIDVVAWGTLAERISQYLSKGRRALVNGRLQQRSWEQDGQKRSKVEVLANDVTFMDGQNSAFSSNSNSEDAQVEQDNQTQEPTYNSDNDKSNDIEEEISIEDVPF